MEWLGKKSELVKIRSYIPEDQDELEVAFNMIMAEWNKNKLVENRFILVLELRKRCQDVDKRG